MTDPVDGGGVNCASVADATQGRLVGSIVGADRYGNETGTRYVAGLVPDHITRVRIDTREGAVVAVPHHNIYGARVETPTRISFAGTARLPAIELR